jgi:hypothetical protein
MTTKQSTKKGGAKGKADAEDLDALARHISEALRIMRVSELIPARIYNSFADAWNELVGTVTTATFFESEAHARLILSELVKRGGAE